jgi:hypothetical protein
VTVVVSAAVLALIGVGLFVHLRRRRARRALREHPARP